MKKKKLKKRHPNKSKEQTKIKAWPDLYKQMFGLVAVVLLGILIYSNSFSCPFQFDGPANIVDNPHIKDLSDLSALWEFNKSRFISFLSFAVNYHFGEFNVWGYHLVNLSIHLINACLVFWLTALIFSCPVMKAYHGSRYKTIFALTVALFFVSHPLSTQSVTYIVQRMASLVTLFYLLSLTFYVKARLTEKRNYIRYILFVGALISAVLALLTKENAFTLPFAIILFELFFLQTKKLTIKLNDLRVVFFLTGLILFFVLLSLVFSFSIFENQLPEYRNDFRTITPLNYLFTQFSVILKYIQLLIIPLNQNLDYDFPLSTSFFDLKTILSFLVLISIIIIGIFQFKKDRIISFGIFWFFLTLSIESSIIPISDLIFEHRTYLPSFGFFLILTSMIYKFLWDKHKKLAIAIVVLIVGTNSILTYERNNVWQDSISLWNDVISKSPEKARPYNMRGMLLRNTNKLDEMYYDFSKAIELQPGFAEAYSNRGNVYRMELKYSEALNDFNKAIALNPFQAEPYNNRGTIFMKQKRFNEALVELTKAIELKPEFAEAFANRGITYLNLGENDKACVDLQKAIGLGFQQSLNLYNSYCK